jgi:hypothetical protein
MASAIGTATINFGGSPGSNEASIDVTGQLGISSTSPIEAYVMASDSTSDHTSSDHKYFNSLVGLSCGNVIAGTGFTIYARSLQKITGTFLVHYIWTD